MDLISLFKICLIALGLIKNGHAQSDIQIFTSNISKIEESIMINVLRGYNKNIRPYDTVTCVIILKLEQIVSLDEKNQIMTTSSFIGIYWYDTRLSWNPNDVNGIEEIQIPVKSVWIPDIIVANSASTNTFFSFNDYQMVNARYDGIIYLSIPAMSLPTRCRINVRKYPFDKQTCVIKIGSLSQSDKRISVFANESNFDSDNYQKNSVWDLVDTDATIDINNEKLSYLDRSNSLETHFIFHLKRKPLHFMINGIFPCFILNIVTLLSFALPFALQVTISNTFF